MKETSWQFYQPVKTVNFPISRDRMVRDIPAAQKGAFNLYVMVPCPIQNKFNRAFKDFIEDYNVRNDAPIWSPTLAGLDHDDVERLLSENPAPQDMPDALIATGLHWFFSESFRSRYIDTGVYVPWIPAGFTGNLPPEWQGKTVTSRTGILAFGSWTIIADRGTGGDIPPISCWEDLADTEFRGKIAIHGCDGNPGCIPLLQLIRERRGEEGLRSFGENVAAVKHFSQIIKNMNTREAGGISLSILPLAAAAQIPSTKKTEEIIPLEGRIFVPLCAMVKKEKLKEAEKALAFFSSDQFREVLASGGFCLADELPASSSWVFPDWKELARGDFNGLADELIAEFQKERLSSPAPAYSGCTV